MKTYTVRRTRSDPFSSGDPATAFAGAETAAIAEFLPQSSDHRPRVTLRMLYDAAALYGWFEVADRYVRCVHRGHQERVCEDSCVEAFLEPEGAGAYVNFEFNCGGAMLAYRIRDSRRVGDGFADFDKLAEADCRTVRRYPSLPARIEPELADPVDWTLGFAIPFAALIGPTGAKPPESGTRWRGNFYKCGDATSHPHWASWAPVDAFNFHLPRCFGTVLFE